MRGPADDAAGIEMLNRYDRQPKDQAVKTKRWKRAVPGLTLAVIASIAATGCGSSETTPQAAPADRSGPAEVSLEAVVYRSPTCGCCKSYEEYLRRHGYTLQSEVTEDMDPVKVEHGVPADAESCQTTLIGGYVVEGHVPVEAIEKLLEERPDIDGIAAPGMPSNSPGMGEPNGEPLDIISIEDGDVKPFMTLES